MVLGSSLAVKMLESIWMWIRIY